MMAVLIGNLGQFKRINWVKLDTTFNRFTLRGDLSGWDFRSTFLISSVAPTKVEIQ